MISSTPWHSAVNDCRRRGRPWVLATVLATRGSTPRDSGSKIVITADHSFDTLGGGQLEYLVVARARELIAHGGACQRLEHLPLSSRAGQCCGGSVSVLLECFAEAHPQVHIFGAGHVARALLPILSTLDLQLHWIDSRAGFLEDAAAITESAESTVHRHHCEDPVDHVARMPAGAMALILTHDHALDYRLSVALLERGDCAFLGMIGSRTKAERFRRRLRSESFSARQIDQLQSPVGLPQVPGKKPAEIAIAIAAQLLVEKEKLAGGAENAVQLDWKSLRESLGKRSETV